ncbi:MAG: inner membrane protein [Candidatus Nanohaloarchaea archaeon]|jgi:inner membrane protein
MGDFSEHVLFGLLTAVLIAFLTKDMFSFNPFESIASVTAVFVGSVLPDVDHKNSYVHRAVKSMVSLVAGSATFFLPLPVVQKYLLYITILVTVYWGIGRMKIRHRGFTHSLSFCAIAVSMAVVASVISLGSPVPGVALGVGLFSHLLLDGEIKIE